MAQLTPHWPFQYQDSAAAAIEKAWGWFGLPAAGEGSQFDAAAAPWAEHDWLAVLGYQMAAQSGGGPAPSPLRLLLGVGV